jgi:23S rRNA (adenine2503-C2)-methyltransferase
MQELNIKQYKTVLFAGMGEPLNNYYHVAKSVGMLLDAAIAEEVSITTSGIVPFMYKLCDVPISRLGISIHATTDETRNLLVPINKKYPLKEVIEAGEHFFVKTGKPVTVNYLLFENVNDTDSDIERLSNLLSPEVFKIKLKHWNDVNVEWLKKSSTTVFDKFITGLTANGFSVTTCISEGADIGAGCGQLHSANRTLRKSQLDTY